MSAHPDDPSAAPAPTQQLAALTAHVAALDHEVEGLRAEINRLKNVAPPPLPWRQWLRHRIKFGLGLTMNLGRLAFPGQSRPLRVPARYHRTPVLPDPPAISIVTPSYNQGSFIEQTLRSVLDQNYPRLEYVVQDGGSKDGTNEVLARYRDRLHHCASHPDRGQAHAINLGFAHTSGEIMAYLNSDDLLLPGALHAVAQFFRTHPDVDAVYGHRVVIDEFGDETGRWVLPPHDPEMLNWLDCIPQETLFWRRRVWDRVGGIDESFRFALDWDFLLRMQGAGARFRRLGRFLGAFRVHTQSKTTTVMSSTGDAEIARLRRRVHGRDVTPAEVRAALRGYFRRHVVSNCLYSIGLLRH
jgi:GT2 family glycosyltransferase